MRQISLLLGAGFSMSAGYPSAKDVNEKVILTNENTFIVDGMGTVGFRPDSDFIIPPPYCHRYLALVTAIQYYIKKYYTFDYEAFYDYLEKEIQHDIHFRHFYEEKYGAPKEEGFCESLTQLYNQIICFYIEAPKGKPHSQYNVFIKWVRVMAADGNIVHLHTLNHDLLIEEFFHKMYSDGFSKDESPYFLKKPYRRTLPMYNGKYSGNIRLYKLHGSFNQYVCKESINTQDYVKIPNGANYTNIYDINGVTYRENYHPDFLTGKTKERKYQTKPFYQNLITRFEENLIASKIVVIIGYSGNDDGINERLKKASGKMIVISPTPNEDFNKEMREAGWMVGIIAKKIEEVTFKEFENIIGSYE